MLGMSSALFRPRFYAVMKWRRVGVGDCKGSFPARGKKGPGLPISKLQVQGEGEPWPKGTTSKPQANLLLQASLPKPKEALFSLLSAPPPTGEPFQKVNKNTKTKSETEVQLSAPSSSGCPHQPQNPWQARANDTRPPTTPQTPVKQNCHPPGTFHVPGTTASLKLHAPEAGLTFPFY